MGESSGSCVYKEWMNLQEQELSMLLQKSLNLKKKIPENASAGAPSDAETASLLEEINQNFLDYNERRQRLARRDAASFLSPNWRTTFENSISWIGGCRPSTYFRLIYALCGSEIDAKLEHFLTGGSSSEFPKFFAPQLSSINDLQRRTITEEEKLSSKVADLQLEIADVPLGLMAGKEEPNDGNLSAEMKAAMGKIEESMFTAMREADILRMKTYKKLLKILTQEQALEFIISAKKLRLYVQAWGLVRDEERRRNDSDAEMERSADIPPLF